MLYLSLSFSLTYKTQIGRRWCVCLSVCLSVHATTGTHYEWASFLASLLISPPPLMEGGGGRWKNGRGGPIFSLSARPKEWLEWSSYTLGVHFRLAGRRWLSTLRANACSPVVMYALVYRNSKTDRQTLVLDCFVAILLHLLMFLEKPSSWFKGFSRPSCWTRTWPYGIMSAAGQKQLCTKLTNYIHIQANQSFTCPRCDSYNECLPPPQPPPPAPPAFILYVSDVMHACMRHAARQCTMYICMHARTHEPYRGLPKPRTL